MNAVDRMMVRGAFTLAEAGLYFGKGKDFINQLIDEGEIGVVILDGKVTVPRFELDNYLKNNRIIGKVGNYIDPHRRSK